MNTQNSRPRVFSYSEVRAMLPAGLGSFHQATNGCWIHEKRSPTGYAYNTSYQGRKANAYKLIWETVNGKQVPKGFDLDHLCDNGAGGCVNPNHLQVATRYENVTRTTRTIPGRNVRKTHCKRGHPLSGKNLLLQRDGKQRRCQQCMNDSNRRHVERDREEFNRKRREHYQRNRERILAQKQALRDRKREAS